jgi:hypothetical protein
MLKRRMIGLVMISCLLMGIGVATGNGPQKEGEKPDPKAEANLQGFEQLTTAYNLIDYARQHKSPLAMLTAVEILHQTPTQEFKGDIEGGEPVKLEPQAERLGNLLKEAQKMRPGDKNLATLIEELQETIKEKPRPIVPELGRPPIFTRQFSGTTTFSRSFVPPTSRLNISTVPGQGLFKDIRLRVVIKRGGVTIRNSIYTLTFANSNRTITFGTNPAANYTIQVTNLSGGSVRLIFNMLQ